ncbi:MAG: hypothetical protein VX498_00155 [Myxococcota bacterium]|nr:hypothetical protein [Myxococcota bacterium]
MRIRLLLCSILVTLITACSGGEQATSPAEEAPAEAAAVPEAAKEAPAAASTAEVCKKIKEVAAASDKDMEDVDLCTAILDGYVEGDAEQGKALFSCLMKVSSLEETESKCEAEFLVSMMFL